MRVSYWWCALLMLGSTHMAYADDASANEPPSMEVIEMLGEIDNEMADFEIAMSDAKIDAKAENRDVNADEKPSAQEVKNAK